MKYHKDYRKLHKPSWAPRLSVFRPVWIMLYIIIAFTYGYVFYLYINGVATGDLVLPFILNLIFNFAFTPIQFRMKNNFLAFIDILLVLATIIWFMIITYQYSTAAGHINPDIRYIIYFNIPYLLWVAYATILQFSITIKNKSFNFISHIF